MSNGATATLVASDLHSDSNLTLQSAQDIIVSGSKVSATGDTQVQAKGDIQIVAAENTARDTTRTDNRGFTASTKETSAGSHEYRVDAGLKDQQHINVTDTTLQQGASISGGALAVSAGGNLSVKGSDLGATGGDVSLSGKNIELMAAHDSTDSKTQDLSTGGGIVWTASLDKVGSGLEFVRQGSEDNASRTTAKTSNVTATGNVRVQADNTLVNEGTRIVAGSGVQVNAGQMDNRAAYNTESSSHTENGWQAGLGVSAEIKGLSTPVEKIVKGLAKGTLPQSGLMDGVELASLGLDGQVGYHNKTQAQQDSTAVVSQLSGATVQVNVGGNLQDEGTQYRATDGALNIKAGSHDARAAADTHNRAERDVAAKVGLRVYTKTGEDVNVRANGSGEFRHAQETGSTAQVGHYAGAQGVSIDTQGDARYEGGDFDGGAGSVNIDAGGKLALQQATDTHSQSAMGLSASGSLALETGEGNSLSPGGSLKFDYSPDNSPTSEAHVATFRGKDRLRLSGVTVGGDLLKGENKEPQSLQAGIDQTMN